MKKYDVVHIAFLVILAAYLALAAFGFGNDNDTYGMIRCGRDLLERGVYHFSRPPGYLIPEIAIGYLSYFGAYVCNLASVAFGVGTLIVFHKIIIRFLGTADALFVVVFVAVNPYYIIASTTSIDYVYSLFFGALSVLLMLRGKHFYAAIPIALCLSSRLAASLSVGLIYAYFILAGIAAGKKREAVESFLGGCLALLLTILLYLPSYASVGNNMGFLTYGIGNWTFVEYLARFVYKNIFLFGLVPFLTVAGFIVFSAGGRETGLRRNLAGLFALAAVLVNEILFFKVPAEISYLLPILFIATPLVVLLYSPSALFRTLVLAFTIFNGFVWKIDIQDITYEQVDVLGINAIAARPGIFFRKGVVVGDIMTRKTNCEKYGRFFNLDWNAPKPGNPPMDVPRH